MNLGFLLGLCCLMHLPLQTLKWNIQYCLSVDFNTWNNKQLFKLLGWPKPMHGIEYTFKEWISENANS